MMRHEVEALNDSYRMNQSAKAYLSVTMSKMAPNLEPKCMLDTANFIRIKNTYFDPKHALHIRPPCLKLHSKSSSRKMAKDHLCKQKIMQQG